MLTPVAEYTRECLSTDVARRLSSEDMLERLAWLFATRGVPEYLRSDNGSEFTCTTVRVWLAKVGVGTLFIEPEALGKTATSSRSTASFGMSYSMARSSLR